MKDLENIPIDELAARQRPGYALERPFYVSQRIFERDLERIVASQWLFVDHVSRIPRAGDYITYEVAGESILIVRNKDNQVVAHHNVCRHRGSRVCTDAQGHTRTLTCPYHGWVYDLDGRLVHAKNMPEGFDHSQWPLLSCPVRVLEGLIFIFLGDAAQAPDFSQIDANLGPFMKLHGLTCAKIVHTEIYPTAGNWKLAVENFRECYHCAIAHPEYTLVNAHVKVNDDAPRSYERITAEWEQRVGHMGHVTGRAASGENLWSQPHSASRRPIREGWLTYSQDGRPVAPLMGDFKCYDGAETVVTFGPLSYMSGVNDYVTLFRFTPVHPTYTEARLTWLVDQNAKEGINYDVGRLRWMWDITTAQDTQLISRNQLGVGSRHYVPGPYSARESETAAFTQWYLSRIV